MDHRKKSLDVPVGVVKDAAIDVGEELRQGHLPVNEVVNRDTEMAVGEEHVVDDVVDVGWHLRHRGDLRGTWGDCLKSRGFLALLRGGGGQWMDNSRRAMARAKHFFGSTAAAQVRWRI